MVLKWVLVIIELFNIAVNDFWCKEICLFELCNDAKTSGASQLVKL